MTPLGGPGSGSLRKLESSNWLWPRSSKGSIWAAGSFSKVAQSHAWRLSRGSRQEVAVAHQVDVSTGLLECPQDMALPSAQSW